MNLVELGRRSLRTVWTHKILWLFGFFVAGGGSSAGAAPGRADGAPLPAWVWPAVVGAVILGVVGFLLHVASEGALIDSVHRSEQGGEVKGGASFGAGFRHFGVVLRIKLLVTAVVLLTVAALGAPMGLFLLGWLPPWVGIVGTVLLSVVGVPWVLSVFFVYEYALRFAILEQQSALASVRSGRQYLHGRVLESLKLWVVSYLGQVGGSVLALGILLPAGLLGLALYSAFGLVPALVVAGTIALPFLALLVGAMGAFRSTVWTLGYLEGQKLTESV